MLSSKMNTYILVVLLATSATVFGRPNQFGTFNSGRIVGGHDAKPGQFPYQVTIQVLGSHNCGGSILNEQWILTAAHCLLFKPERYTIKAGLTDINDASSDVQIRKVVAKFKHPKYPILPIAAPYDIGLMKLDSPLKFNSKVNKINVPEKNSIPKGTATLSGWGSTSNTTSAVLPNTLQTIDLPIVPYDECNEFMGNSPLAETNVCTGPLGGHVSACSGDSGGPLAQNGAVIGIVSWGRIPCGVHGYPSVFTRVSAYNDFINDIITQNS